MTRRVIGVAMACTLAVSSASAATGEPKIETMREADRITVTLRTGDLTVTQIVTRTGVDLRLTHQGDTVQFAGDLAGRIAVARGGQSRAFALRYAQAADQSALNALLADSPALGAFDKLLHGEWARRAESAVMFKSTREVIRVLQGEPAVVLQMAAAARTPSPASIVAVRQRLSPSQCWDTYARDVIHFTYELQSCLNSASYSWNPLATAWCSYEYNLKSSLSAVWLLDCYGVPV